MNKDLLQLPVPFLAKYLEGGEKRRFLAEQGEGARVEYLSCDWNLNH